MKLKLLMMNWQTILLIIFYLEGVMLIYRSTEKGDQYRIVNAVCWPVVVFLLLLIRKS